MPPYFPYSHLVRLEYWVAMTLHLKAHLPFLPLLCSPGEFINVRNAFDIGQMPPQLLSAYLKRPARL